LKIFIYYIIASRSTICRWSYIVAKHVAERHVVYCWSLQSDSSDTKIHSIIIISSDVIKVDSVVSSTGDSVAADADTSAPRPGCQRRAWKKSTAEEVTVTAWV